ncbi:hypothetical protein ILYODFUR_038600 [Ilyodon furcidens]|uniref:Uncharacterized protein n=1 Tax=Ilyodon furcidens TaxID=33524 RepID=A0ABV0UZX5_9TELE
MQLSRVTGKISVCGISHFNSSEWRNLAFASTKSSVSHQIPAGGPKSSPGKGSVCLLKTAVRTVFTGVYRPAGNLRRSWNPALEGPN